MAGPLSQNIIIVPHLFTSNRKRWDVAKVQGMFPNTIVNRIVGSLVSQLGKLDCLVWTESAKGLYSVKLGYQYLYKQEGLTPQQNNFPWKQLWTFEGFF